MKDMRNYIRESIQQADIYYVVELFGDPDLEPILGNVEVCVFDIPSVYGTYRAYCRKDDVPKIGIQVSADRFKLVVAIPMFLGPEGLLYAQEAVAEFMSQKADTAG